MDKHRAIDITGTIDAGWARLTFSFDYRYYEIEASYLDDSLTDLRSAVILIAYGDSTATCSFLSEPGKTELSFTREKENLVVHSGCSDFLVSDSEIKKMSWTETVRSTDFTKAILRLFARWEKDYPGDEYKMAWMYDFPADKLSKLKKALGKM